MAHKHVGLFKTLDCKTHVNFTPVTRQGVCLFINEPVECFTMIHLSTVWPVHPVLHVCKIARFFSSEDSHQFLFQDQQLATYWASFIFVVARTHVFQYALDVVQAQGPYNLLQLVFIELQLPQKWTAPSVFYDGKCEDDPRCGGKL